jgi:hypothetical protein
MNQCSLYRIRLENNDKAGKSRLGEISMSGRGRLRTYMRVTFNFSRFDLTRNRDPREPASSRAAICFLRNKNEIPAGFRNRVTRRGYRVFEIL